MKCVSVCFDSAISHVRDVEYPALHPLLTSPGHVPAADTVLPPTRVSTVAGPGGDATADAVPPPEISGYLPRRARVRLGHGPAEGLGT